MLNTISTIEHLLHRHLFFSKDSPFFIYCHQIEHEHRLHDHDFYELMIITEGTGMHHTPHGTHPLQRGDMVMMLPGTWHGMSDCHALGVNVCAINPTLLENELHWLHRDPTLAPLLSSAALSLNQPGAMPVSLNDAVMKRCRRHIFELRQYADQDPYLVRSIQIGHLLMFLGELARFLSVQQLSSQQINDNLSPIVWNAKRTLEDNPKRAWTLDELSRRFDITPTHMIRLFRANTGETPIAYLNLQRLKRASWLLIVKDGPIAAIGAEVGFDDPNHFARRFKAEFGLSPRAYRAKYSKI